MVKLAFFVFTSHQDVDLLRCKELNSFATECVLQPRRPRRSLPPLPEGKECSNMELQKCGVMQRRMSRIQCLILPALPEYDEC